MRLDRYRRAALVSLLLLAAAGCKDDDDESTPRHFTFVDAGFAPAAECALAWGDYDADGDLDLALSGYDDSNTDFSRIYRNDGGAFTDIGAGLTAVRYAAVAWGDYDADGHLDLALAGQWWDGAAHFESKVYRNDVGTFVDTGVPLTGLAEASLAWGDCDNDGDLDLALSGYYNDGTFHYVCEVNLNTGSAFSTASAGLQGFSTGEVAWGDFDNDGDLDLAAAGRNTAAVYRNDVGSFTDITAGLTAVDRAALAWGDYDGDGDLDLILAGQSLTLPHRVTTLYRNDGGTFVDSGVAFEGVCDGALSWGDYDNDGDLDLAMAGEADAGNVTAVFRNDGGGFTDVEAPLPGVRFCSLSWGDYDNDGDVDLAIAGYDDGTAHVAGICRNDGGSFSNVAPAAPTDLTTSLVAGGVTFSWSAPAAADATPPAGLSYNLRVGTSPGDDDVVGAHADTATGLRRIAERGAIQPGVSSTEWTVSLAAGTYYWSVQAIDTSLAGGAWAQEETVVVP